MSINELRKAVTDFFSDRSRSQQETRNDLLDLIDEMQMMVESLEGEDE